MKTIVLLLFLISVSFNSIGQEESSERKSKILVTNDIIFETDKFSAVRDGIEIQDYRYLSFGLTPQVSYFVTNNLALGILVDILMIKNVGYDFIIGTGPAINYYFNNGIILGVNSRINFAFEPGESSISNIKMVTPSVGYSWLITSKVSIEPRIRYDISFGNNNSIEWTRNSLNYLLSISILI